MFNAVLVPRTNLSFPGLHLRDGGEIARAVCLDYHAGRSAEISQASDSDKLAGRSKPVTARISIARPERKQTCGGGQAPHQ